MMRTKLAAALAILFFTSPCFGETNQLEFRPVITEAEASKVPHKEFSYAANPSQKPQDILVADEAVLSNRDFQFVEIIRKEDDVLPAYLASPAINIRLTLEGKEKFYQATKRNKQIAIVFNGELLGAPRIIEPINTGFVQVRSWKIDTDDKAAALVKEIEFEPVFWQRPKK